ncbi:MAG: hypothetical protein AB1567_02725 [bacterium]
MQTNRKDKRFKIELALAEIVNRLTTQEKETFLQAVNWDELRQLREKVGEKRRYGDPKLYVGTTYNGLSCELPEDKVIDCLSILPEIFSSKEIEISVWNDEERIETSCTSDKFINLLKKYEHFLIEGCTMIECDVFTLISGGGGCISITIERISNKLIKKVAENFLAICGFKQKFSKDKFSAILWNDKLEVEE